MANKVLNNVSLEWCKFNSQDQYGHYGCKVVLTPEASSKMTKLGLKFKTEDGVNFFRARAQEPVEVVDKNLAPVSGTIANGATANIMLDVYQYKKYGGGIACRLKKVQLIDFDYYEEGESFAPVDDDQEDAPF